MQAYLISLTDEYPPFSLSGDAGTAGNDTYVISSIVGALLFAAVIGGIVVGWSSCRAPSACRFPTRRCFRAAAADVDRRQ